MGEMIALAELGKLLEGTAERREHHVARAKAYADLELALTAVLKLDGEDVAQAAPEVLGEATLAPGTPVAAEAASAVLDDPGPVATRPCTVCGKPMLIKMRGAKKKYCGSRGRARAFADKQWRRGAAEIEAQHRREMENGAAR
jgi:hypothetical protein